MADTDLALMPAALGASALSYGALSYAFALIGASVGIAVPLRTLVTIGFVSIALSQFAAGGGMAGYAVRLVLMRQRGSVPGDILAASLLYSSLSRLVLLALLPVGLGYLLVEHPLSGHIMTAIILAVGLLLVLVVLTAESGMRMFSSGVTTTRNLLSTAALASVDLLSRGALHYGKPWSTDHLADFSPSPHSVLIRDGYAEGRGSGERSADATTVDDRGIAREVNLLVMDS